MTSPEQDADAMLRLQNGEDLALNEIMDRWQQPLANYIFRYIGNETDAVDLTQETFVRVYEKRHTFEPNSHFSSWLFTIATNLCRNHFRWRSRHRTAPLDGQDENKKDRLNREPVDSGPSPLQTLEAREKANAIREAIDSLSPDLKEAILLFEYENRSYEEISKVLGCSVKAVEMKLYRARQTLKERLLPEKV